MSWNTVSEVDAGPDRRWIAVRAIREAGEETPDPADGDPDSQRNRKQISCSCSHAEVTLRPFHGDETADKAADDRLSANPERLLAPITQQRRLLEKRQQAASERRPDECGYHNSPSRAAVE